MNGPHVETNTVQNLGSAAHLNQFNMNSPSSTVQNTVNNHSDSVQSNGKGKIKSDTSLPKPRPKRACVIDRAERKKSGLYKLGKHIEGRDGSWKIILTNTSLAMFQCPICDTILHSPESRITHEVEIHSLLLESIHKYVNIISNPENTACTQQLSLCNYLKLCVTSKYKTSIVNQLAQKKYLLKQFNDMTFETKERKTIDYNCKYCPYESKFVFALWAHMYSLHANLKCESEKKSPFFYCFLCKCTLTKHEIPLKHLDACIKKMNELPITNISPKPILACEFCDKKFDLLSELEKHNWAHATM